MLLSLPNRATSFVNICLYNSWADQQYSLYSTLNLFYILKATQIAFFVLFVLPHIELSWQLAVVFSFSVWIDLCLHIALCISYSFLPHFCLSHEKCTHFIMSCTFTEGSIHFFKGYVGSFAFQPVSFRTVSVFIVALVSGKFAVNGLSWNVDWMGE
jgi:hypothetical protein